MRRVARARRVGRTGQEFVPTKEHGSLEECFPGLLDELNPWEFGVGFISYLEFDRTRF
jgi:hypothetical protein